MKYRRLGKSGVKLSEIGLGGWLTFGHVANESTGRELIDTAFDAGINFFDTANVYAGGECESMWGSLLSAGLLVFVEVMKELPATLDMRPFNFDTLAVQAYNLASDERLTEASTASLAIVLVGILPLITLSRAIARSRPGERD